MSSPLSHPNQTTANQELATHLSALHSDAHLGDASRQWRLTLYFYAAVHHVEEHLQRKSYPASGTHGQRKRNMAKVWAASHPSAVKAYMDLETQSKETRYKGFVPSDTHLVDAEAQLVEVLNDLV